eukprot:1282664-Amphidinium_carterae.1
MSLLPCWGFNVGWGWKSYVQSCQGDVEEALKFLQHDNLLKTPKVHHGLERNPQETQERHHVARSA